MRQAVLRLGNEELRIEVRVVEEASEPDDSGEFLIGDEGFNDPSGVTLWPPEE